MKYLRFCLAIFALCLFSCNQDKDHKESKVKVSAAKANTARASNSSGMSKDKKEIQQLIRKTLNWAESKNSIDLLPELIDSKDTIVTGFDLEKLKTNLEHLKATNLFSEKFIENYNQIILTLDKGLKDGRYGKCRADELPTFSFANDVDPWCDCQDVPYDKPNAWDLLELKVIDLDNEKGELYWTFGGPELNSSPDWKEFKYKFGVEKENGRWKISYMQGFDFKESIRRDGV